MSQPAPDNKTLHAQQECFSNVAEYENFAERLKTDLVLQQFEHAADAIAAGDLDGLQQHLKANPALVAMRSLCNHHATLLNYTGANGVEAYRQKTPSNITAIARLLLESGAEVDAWGDMYGGTSTLGLAATSVHPVKAGVQRELLELLFEYGADPNHAVAPDYTGGMLILACIHNGRYEPIHYLAEKGARIDLEGACALGDLNTATRLFEDEKNPKSLAGLCWACQYGHDAIVEYLLGAGVPVDAQINGTTPLHSAAFGGQLELVKMLVGNGAPMEGLNDYGGTVLGQTLWCLYNHREPAHSEIMELLIAKGAMVQPDWWAHIDEVRRNKNS